MTDPIPSGGVVIWSASLVRETVEEGLLSPDEITRGKRLVAPLVRGRFFAAHTLLRRILAVHTDCRPEELRFHTSAFGKPALAGEEREDGVRFTISHSGDLLLVAVCRGRELGVDVEEVRVDMDFQAIAAHYFSPAEREALHRLPPLEQPAAFYRCWTRKEAYIKGRGAGLHLPLDQFAVTLAPDEPAAIIHDLTLPAASPCWQLADLAVPAGFVAALAVPGTMPPLVYRDYQVLST
ncbi:MAG TPA: 4'-phosphopantetheinyl transferase superfamily protein [Geobacteraceae bacterium]